jgi:dTDP-4-amino-4,6-dideoxygalactose transaminase
MYHAVVSFDALRASKVSAYALYHCLVASPKSGSVPMLDFSRQSASLREEILAALAEVYDSQTFILGPRVEMFEHAAAEVCGASFAIGCASGTDALWLALAAHGIGSSTRGVPASSADAVITSPFSFFASASAILRAGARPVFADIDPRTFNINPESVREALDDGEGTNVRAVLAVHLYGQCADFEALTCLKNQLPGLLLLEDAAQACGATWQGKPAGSLGSAAAFSFYPTKNLAAMGDAGMTTTGDESMARRARQLRTHGMPQRYLHDEVGWNCRLDAIQAAVLLVKLRHLPDWNQRRRHLAERYDALFRDAGLAAPDTSTSAQDGVVLPWTDPRGTHIFHQYVIRAAKREALRERLKEKEIGTEVYYPIPIHLQPAMRELGYRPGDFPEAERAAAEVLALPMYPELKEDEQEIVVEAIRRFYT